MPSDLPGLALTPVSPGNSIISPSLDASLQGTACLHARKLSVILDPQLSRALQGQILPFLPHNGSLLLGLSGHTPRPQLVISHADHCRSLWVGALPPALPITLLPKWPSKNTILIMPASCIRPFPTSSEPTKQYQNSTEQKAHQPSGCPARSILSSSQIPARLNCSSAPSSGPLPMLFPVCLP